VAESTVYARIQELSGWAGRGHRSFLPARPYVEPARMDQLDHIGQIAASRIGQALGG
jgi:phage gpG-like protein